MSLKAFHLVFVTATIALSFGCGVWGLKDYCSTAGTVSDLLFGIGAFAFGGGMIVYERLFLKKLKGVRGL